LLIYILDFQKEMHTLLAKHIQQVAKSPDTYGWSLIGLSFTYGAFHAIGPGHGKAVIVTYLSTQKETIKSGIFISLIAALLQSLIAIALISILVMIMSLKFTDVKAVGEEITLASYLLVSLLGAFVSLRSIRKLYEHYAANKKEHLGVLKLPKTKPTNFVTAIENHTDKVHSSHPHQCNCNHAHAPKSDQSIFQTCMVILSMGLRPCSGALVVLIYAQLVSAYQYGIVATLAMGLGTGLSISLIALASIYARKWLEHIYDRPKLIRWNLQSAPIYLSLAGGTFLVIIGWGLFTTASQISTAHPLL